MKVVSATLCGLGIVSALAGLLPCAATAQTKVFEPRSAEGVAVAQRYGKLPLGFEANRGQTDARVQFLSRGDGFTLFLSGDQAILELQSVNARPPAPGTKPDGFTASPSMALFMNLAGARKNRQASGKEPLPGRANYLLGSDPAKWHRNLQTYRKVHYAGVYRGIDLDYYGTQGRLEYDFLVAPRADPNKIRLQFSGAKPSVDASGDLVLSFAGKEGENEIRFQKPVLYQRTRGVRRAVNGEFTLFANDEVGFRVGAYDHTSELIIDPMLVYSSYLGGSSQQSVVNGMALNAAGDIYVSGITMALDYPTTAGVIQPTCPAPPAGSTKCGPSSLSAAFVSKIAADGQSLLYSTYLGGSGSGPGVGGSAVSVGGSGADYGVGVAVDANDEAWVLGITNSNNFPITTDAYEVYCSPASLDFNFNTGLDEGELSDCARFNDGGEYIYGAQSGFLVKLNPAGTSILYGTFLGGTDTNIPTAIALDSDGNVYVAGETSSAGNAPPANSGSYNFPTTDSGFQTTGFTGGFVGFLSELSADGHTLLYSTLFTGTAGNTFVQGLAVSGVGQAAIGGYTLSASLPVSDGALQTTCNTNGGTNCAGQTGFVASFDTTQSGAASLVFATYLSGQTPIGASNYVSAIAADSAGDLYVTGPASQFDYPTTDGVLQPTCNHQNSGNSCQGAFVTKLTLAGEIVWSTFYTSPSSNGRSDPPVLALDSQNNVYISANDDGGGDIPLQNPFQGYVSGFAYVTELSNDGSQVLFGSYYGGGTNIIPTGIAVDANDNIIFVGYTSGGDLPLVDAFQSTDGGGYNEGFFAKISLATGLTVTSLSPTNAAAGSGAFTLTVDGAGFVPASVVNFNGNTKSTTFVNATQITAAITAVDIAAAGTLPVTVTNPGPGGSTSTPVNFTVNNPTPVISSISPTSATTGGPAFTLTVNGSGFVPASTVKFNGNARTTVFVTSTQLSAAITVADIAEAGTANVSVTNAAPGGGTSGNATFTISNSSSSSNLMINIPGPGPVIVPLSTLTFTFNVQSMGGLAGVVNTTCASATVGCFVSPCPAPLTANHSVLLTTTLCGCTPTGTSVPAFPRFTLPLGWRLALALIACLLLAALIATPKKNTRWAFAAASLTFALIVGCGGGATHLNANGSPALPVAKGQYTLTITAKSGNITQSTQVTASVQ